MSKRLMHKAMEAIWFQDGKFGITLEETLEKIRNKYSSLSSAQKSSEVKDIVQSIFDYTGITCSIILDDDAFAATLPPLVNANHVFKNDGYSLMFEDSKLAIRNVKKLSEESTVNYKEGRITGSFSKLKSKIYLGFNTLIRNEVFTIKEVTAILLHEIGHNFTMFEFLNRMITTNQVLAVVSKSIMDKETAEQRSFLLKTAGDIICNDSTAFTGYEDITDVKTLTTVMVDESLRRAGSEVGFHYYDQTAMESLADQYAARHGYGRDLVLALDKASKGSFEYMSTAKKLFVFLLEILTVLFSLFFLVAVTFNVISVICIVILYEKVFMSGYQHRDFTYDNLKVRYKRVREQEVERLKDKFTDAEEKKRILDSIRILDELLLEINGDEFLFEKIHLFFSKKSRDVKAAIQLQRDLEELSANNLFVASAKLAST